MPTDFIIIHYVERAKPPDVAARLFAKNAGLQKPAIDHDAKRDKDSAAGDNHEKGDADFIVQVFPKALGFQHDGGTIGYEGFGH